MSVKLLKIKERSPLKRIESFRTNESLRILRRRKVCRWPLICHPMSLLQLTQLSYVKVHRLGVKGAQP